MKKQPEHNRKNIPPQDTAKAPKSAVSRSMRTRAIVLAALFVLVGFGAVVYNLYQLQIVQHDELAARAENQQLADETITPNRGVIYDSDMKVLARSNKVWTVVASPRDMAKSGTNINDVAVKLAELLELEDTRVRLLELIDADAEAFAPLAAAYGMPKGTEEEAAAQQAALQAQTLAQERAQAEGVGAAYTKYVRPLLERAALGLSTALSPIPSVPGSEPGTGLAQAIETSNANYERNKMHDISGRPVHGQGVDATGEFAYGNSRMKDSGCGVIGTYNALYLLGKEPSLAEVGRRYEISGAMAGGGAWGTNPYGAPQVLKQYGVQYEEYTDPDALEREAGEGDVMIVSIWNRKGTIFEGYHTFAVQKVNGELMVYNRFNNSAESTEKKTMGEVIENGQFIVGYRVQNAK